MSSLKDNQRNALDSKEVPHCMVHTGFNATSKFDGIDIDKVIVHEIDFNIDISSFWHSHKTLNSSSAAKLLGCNKTKTKTAYMATIHLQLLLVMMVLDCFLLVGGFRMETAMAAERST